MKQWKREMYTNIHIVATEHSLSIITHLHRLHTLHIVVGVLYIFRVFNRIRWYYFGSLFVCLLANLIVCPIVDCVPVCVSLCVWWSKPNEPDAKLFRHFL